MKRLLNILALVLLLAVCVNFVRTMKRLSIVSDEMDKLKGDVASLETEKKKLIAETREAETPEYVEKQLREKLGLGKEGEVIYVLPKTEITPSDQVTDSEQEERLENWQLWAIKFGF